MDPTGGSVSVAAAAAWGGAPAKGSDIVVRELPWRALRFAASLPEGR